MFTPSFLGTICSYTLLIEKVSLLRTQNIVIAEQKIIDSSEYPRNNVITCNCTRVLAPLISTQKDFRHLSVAVVFFINYLSVGKCGDEDHISSSGIPARLVSIEATPANAAVPNTASQPTSVIIALAGSIATAVWQNVFSARIPAAFIHFVQFLIIYPFRLLLCPARQK